jgi:hypothetical protein
MVTLLEKLEAISKRFERGTDPADYVRHYEDASRIISSEAGLPALDGGLPLLVREVLASKDLGRSLKAEDPAFSPVDGGAWPDIERARAARAALHWGAPQRSLGVCCDLIRDWLRRNPVAHAMEG